MTQDAVFVQAFDLLQRVLDTRGDCGLLVAACGVGTRIETGVKQLDDVGGNGGVFDQRRPHVILRIGHANLAQEARHRPDQRHIAPGQATAAASARCSRRSRRSRASPSGTPLPVVPCCCRDRSCRRRHVRAACRAARAPAVALRLDVIGALVHHAKAHVFQHGNALGQRKRAARKSRLSGRPSVALPQDDGGNRRPAAFAREVLRSRACRRPQPSAHKPRGNPARTRPGSD